MTLYNARSGRSLATRVTRADNPFRRLVGLLAQKRVDPDEGLWIEGCGAVHTMGMRATLDLFFLDAAHCVLKIESGVRPNRLAVMCRGAKTVVELGAIAESRDVLVGDPLRLQ